MVARAVAALFAELGWQRHGDDPGVLGGLAHHRHHAAAGLLADQRAGVGFVLAGKLRLEPTISEAMAALPSARFERVLHPVFEQDEAILIAVGAALGAVVGLAQAVLG